MSTRCTGIHTSRALACHATLPFSQRGAWDALSSSASGPRVAGRPVAAGVVEVSSTVNTDMKNVVDDELTDASVGARLIGVLPPVAAAPPCAVTAKNTDVPMLPRMAETVPSALSTMRAPIATGGKLPPADSWYMTTPLSRSTAALLPPLR